MHSSLRSSPYRRWRSGRMRRHLKDCVNQSCLLKSLGPTRPKYERRNYMSNTKETRVLSRQAARELTQEELNKVPAGGGSNGGLRTLTLWTFDEEVGKDGNVGEG